MPTMGQMTSEEFDQWLISTDRRIHDLELRVLQLVEEGKQQDARITALELALPAGGGNPGASD